MRAGNVLISDCRSAFFDKSTIPRNSWNHNRLFKPIRIKIMQDNICPPYHVIWCKSSSFVKATYVDLRKEKKKHLYEFWMYDKNFYLSSRMKQSKKAKQPFLQMVFWKAQCRIYHDELVQSKMYWQQWITPLVVQGGWQMWQSMNNSKIICICSLLGPPDPAIEDSFLWLLLNKLLLIVMNKAIYNIQTKATIQNQQGK